MPSPTFAPHLFTLLAGGLALTLAAAQTPNDSLVSYAWDGEGEVPASGFNPASGQLPPLGERGAVEGARFYLPFNGGSTQLAYLGSAVAHQGIVDAQGTVPTQGVFGGALSFPNAEASLRLSIPGRHFLGDTWSIEFWAFLPATTVEQEVLLAPGAFRLTMSRDGHCFIKATGPDADPIRLKSRDKFLPGQWNHIGMSLDGPDLRQIRFSLNGVAKGRFIKPKLQFEKVIIGGFVGAIDDLLLSETPVNSNVFVDRAARVIKPGSHKLQLTYADRVETVSTWASALTQPVVTGDLWQQGQSEHAAERNGALQWLPADWTLYKTNTPPLPRTTHPTVYVGDNRVFMFGGETRDSHVGGMVNTDDTWIFHTDTGQWERSQSKLAPPISCHQSAAYSPDHNVVLYAGGQLNQRDEFEIYDQTWLYHVDTDQWEKIEPSGDYLKRQSDGATVYNPVTKKFLLFSGGHRMMEFDPVTRNWLQLPRTAAQTRDGASFKYIPGGSPMAAFDPERNNVVVYGGGVAGVWQDRTATFDVASSTFTIAATTDAPPARLRSSFAYDSTRKRFVLFGGVKDQMSIRDGDLWMYLPGEQKWIELDSNNTPAARGGFYHMAYDPDIDRFIMLCGRLEPRIFQNEAWALHVDETATGTATYVFDRHAFASLGHWYAEWEQPEGSQVSFRFRGSDDGINWGAWSAVAIGDEALVQVEVSLVAGGLDAAPKVRRMGFFGSVPGAGAAGLESVTFEVMKMRD